MVESAAASAVGGRGSKGVSTHALLRCPSYHEMRSSGAGWLTLSSKVSSVRAAFRIFERAICTRQSSRLFRRPYSPTAFSSASSRSFSYGRRGFLKVLPSAQRGDGQAPGSPPCSPGAGEPGAAAHAHAALLQGYRGACQARGGGRTVVVEGDVRHGDRPPLPAASCRRGRRRPTAAL